MACTVSTSPVAASTLAASEPRPLCELPLPVEPADRLLEGVASPVDLGAALQKISPEQRGDELNLLYVAATRARRHLIVNGIVRAIVRLVHSKAKR